MPTSDVCGAGSTWNEAAGECQVNCAAGTVLEGNECVPDGSVICETGTTYNTTTGKCDPDITGCAEGTVLIDGECIPYDDTLVGDVTEPEEPNGYTGTPGSFTLPEIGDSVTISGCITPYEDADDSGNLDGDFDAYLFSVSGQTLIEVTVDGIGGLAGAFELDGLDDQLYDGGWFRFGVNLVNDTTKRQVFLPKAGTYLLAITDGRALLFGEGAGDENTCYYVTVREIAIPTPTAFDDAATLLCEDATTTCATHADCDGIGYGACLPTVLDTMGNDVQFFSYDPNEGDLLWTTMDTDSEAMVPGYVNGVNNSVFNFTQYDPGNPAEVYVWGLADADNMVIAVDNYYNIGLVEADYMFRIAAPGTVEANADGDATITPGRQFVSYLPYNSWFYFDGAAGDVLHLKADSETAVDCRMIDFEEGIFLTPAMTLAYDEWIQLTHAGSYYIGCNNPDETEFTLTTARDHVTPTVLEVGTLIDDAALTEDNVNWFELDVSASDWLVFSTPEFSFDGNMVVDAYSRTNSGQIDYYVPGVDGFDFATVDDEAGRIVVGDDSVFLIGISDDGDFAATTPFDFLVDNRDFTDLGVIDEDTDVNLTDISLAADATGYYLARSDVFNNVDFTVTGGTDFDPVVSRLDREEGVTDVYDETGAAEAETFSTLMAVHTWVAFTVEESGGLEGTFGVSTDATEEPGESEPNDTPGLADTAAIPGYYYGTWDVDDYDFYRINLAEGSYLSLETFDETGPMNCSDIDSIIVLIASDGTTQIAGDDDGGVNACSKLSWLTNPALRDMAAGSYYVLVYEYSGNPGTYYLDIQAQVPVCGNGDIEWGETCDDSQTPPQDGDGCSALCQIEPVEMTETESNDTYDVANDLADALGFQVAAAVTPSDDVDWYTFTLAATSTVYVSITDGATDTCASENLDSELTLYEDDASTVIESDDDGGDVYCSALVGTSLAAGTYYIEAQASTYWCSGCTFDYTLNVTILGE